MLIVQKPQIFESHTETCAHHKRYPGVPWPGCTCTTSFSSRDKPEKEWTPEERENYFRAMRGAPPVCRHCGR